MAWKFNPFTGKLDYFEQAGGGGAVSSVNTRTGAVTGLAENSDLTAHTSSTANPHSVTKAQVGLSAVPNTDFTAAVDANTAKVTNATHTGEVTGATALTIAAGVVGIAKLSATGTPSASNFLRGDNTWSTPAGSGDMVLANAQTNSGLKTFLEATFGLRNVANTITSFFTNVATVARTWTFPDKNGTVAMTSDITGTNSGTNTGDQTITLTGGVTGSGTGSFAATVVTNANLTGVITSTGNATAIADAALSIGKTSGLQSALDLKANLASPTFTGTVVLPSGQALIAPALGTPASGVMTNVTGIVTAGLVNNAVTNAKAAQMATKTYKGRTSALTGDSEDVAVATLKTDLVLVKADVGLGSVDNTTDAAKPVSTAQQTALNLKADDSVVVKLTGAQTVAGAKTFSTPIATASVATMSATVGGGVPTPPNNTTTFLRGDGTFAAPAGSGTVTNVSSANADATVATQTTTPVITVVQTPALRSATTTVNVASATAPTAGQALIATSATTATWQTLAGGGDVTLAGVQTLTNKTVTDPILPETVSPTTPPAASVKLFGRSKGGRMMAAQIGPSGLDTALQPFLGSNKIAMWSHSGNSTAITAPTLFLLNMAHVAGNQEGAATARNLTAATNILNGVRRLGHVTTGAINLSVGIRQLITQWFRGDATTKGGFFMTARFGYNTAAAGNRGFVGFSSNVGAFTITADPSATGTASTAICIGLGFDAADTNWQVFARTATGNAVTKTDTGIAKPVANNFYEVAIFSAPEATTVSLAIQDLSTGAIYQLSTSTALPPQNQLMSQRVWGNTGTSASILGLDTSLMYIETDY